MKVIIASKNPVKIKAVRLGFEKMFPGRTFEFLGLAVPSGVPDQPASDVETLAGARNRAIAAAAQEPAADFWVGLEGGVSDTDQGMESFAWIVVRSADRSGQARTGTFFLPQAVTELVRQGKELGQADDLVFGQSNSKQANGAVGLLTGDAVTRTSFYAEAVALALIPFKNPDLYK